MCEKSETENVYPDEEGTIIDPKLIGLWKMYGNVSSLKGNGRLGHARVK